MNSSTKVFILTNTLFVVSLVFVTPAISQAGEPSIASLEREHVKHRLAHEEAIEKSDSEAAILAVRLAADVEREILRRAEIDIPDNKEILDRLRNRLNTSVDWLAGQSFIKGDYDQALQLFQESLTLSEVLHGERDWRTVTVRVAIANTQQRADMTAEQLNQLAEAVRLNESVGQLSRAGKHRDVETLLIKNLAIHRRVFSPKHSDIAGSLIDMAKFYADNGDRAKAILLFRESLEIRREVFGLQHPAVADILIQLAESHFGDHEAALPLLQECLEIREEALGPLHPDSIHAMETLCGLYGLLGEHEKVLALVQKRLETTKESLGPQHPDVATVLLFLAGVHRAMDDQSKALVLYQQCAEIRRNALGEQHPDTITSLRNLASLREAMGNSGKLAVDTQ